MYPADPFPSIACVIDIANSTIENFNLISYLIGLLVAQLFKFRGIGVLNVP